MVYWVGRCLNGIKRVCFLVKERLLVGINGIGRFLYSRLKGFLKNSVDFCVFCSSCVLVGGLHADEVEVGLFTGFILVSSVLFVLYFLLPEDKKKDKNKNKENNMVGKLVCVKNWDSAMLLCGGAYIKMFCSTLFKYLLYTVLAALLSRYIALPVFFVSFRDSIEKFFISVLSLVLGATGVMATMSVIFIAFIVVYIVFNIFKYYKRHRTS